MFVHGKPIWLIGDPHIGRKFEVGVPAHRRGEREARQRQLFIEELRTPGAEMVVMVGDLFDHPYVGYATLKETADDILSAAADNPKTVYVMMAGNHDKPRNVTAIGIWTIFTDMLVDRLDNLLIVSKPEIIDGVAFYPWEWGVPAVEQVLKGKVDVAIGHWDLASYGGDDSHLVPVEALLAAHGEDVTLYSGHYHTSGVYNVGGTSVVCTGSLEPYSHGEDPDGDLYVTVTLDELRSAEGDAFRDKCVRVVLRPGEEPPTIDCLALTKVKAEDVADEGATIQRVSLDNFDWNGILKKKLEPLASEVKTFIEERMPGHGEDATE